MIGEYGAYVRASTEKLDRIRARLAAGADTTVMAALTHLWERETERSAIAIQKEMDKQSKLEK